MSTCTSSGVVQRDRSVTLRDGTMFVRRHGMVFDDVIAIDLNSTEKRHLARLLIEGAANEEYERRALTRDRDLPAVGSFGGC